MLLLGRVLFQYVAKSDSDCQQLGDLGSFGESSLASRRKRGPVAFRPRLLAGLVLSLQLLSIIQDNRFV